MKIKLKNIRIVTHGEIYDYVPVGSLQHVLQNSMGPHITYVIVDDDKDPEIFRRRNKK